MDLPRRHGARCSAVLARGHDRSLSGLDSEPTEPSNVSNRTCYEGGDIEKGFAEADVVVEGEFVTKPIHQGYIEPHACVADTGQDGKTVIWCSSQGHFRVRSQTAAMLGWDHVAPSR